MRAEIEIVSHGGLAGVVHYREGPNAHTFPWELGVGATLLTIYVPGPADWDTAVPWAAGRRATVLERLGRAAARREFPFGRVELTERWIAVLAPRPPWRAVGEWFKRLAHRRPSARQAGVARGRKGRFRALPEAAPSNYALQQSGAIESRWVVRQHQVSARLHRGLCWFIPRS